MIHSLVINHFKKYQIKKQPDETKIHTSNFELLKNDFFKKYLNHPLSFIDIKKLNHEEYDKKFNGVIRYLFKLYTYENRRNQIKNYCSVKSSITMHLTNRYLKSMFELENDLSQFKPGLTGRIVKIG